jgi:alpha-L-fucosidase
LIARRDLLIAGCAGVAAACRTGAPAALPGPGTGRPRPSPSQLAWHRRELALFLHFGVNTFTDREWGDGTEDPRVFAPTALDARQWTRAARAGGFHTVILTAKHHDGFCLWPSALTTHSVASSPWQQGRGDVVRELADAARADGLGLGLYLSPWDRHEPSYGSGERYNDFYCGQLTELLTRYGPVTEVWFDGANGEGPNGRRQEYDWPRIHRVVRRWQPEAVIFSDAGPDIRWAGNERGVAGEPNWCTVDPRTVPRPGVSGDAVTQSLLHGDPDGSVWRPAECDVSIRPGWFWHPAEDTQVRTEAGLLDLYLSSVGRNSGLLLNVPPTREGLLHAVDVARLAGFDALRRSIFEHDLARSARITTSRGAGRSTSWLQLDLPRPVAFDFVSLQEAIAHGQSITTFAIDRWNDSWVRMAEGTTVGYRRIVRVTPAATSRIRVSVTSPDAPARLARVSLHALPTGVQLPSVSGFR